MRPVLQLDLDGVLNPFAAPVCPDGYQERVRFPGEEPVRFCPAHAGWIRELAAAGELWWATGWGDNANEIYLPLLGVGPLPSPRTVPAVPPPPVVDETVAAAPFTVVEEW